MTQLIGLGGQKNANFTFWDTNQQYRTDDMVVYSNEIYSANENIAAGTAWNSAQWTLVLGGGGSTIPDGTSNDQMLMWSSGTSDWQLVPNMNFWNFPAFPDDSTYEMISLAEGSTPSEGSRYYNTTTNKVRIYDGTTWSDLGGGSLPSGSNPSDQLYWDGTGYTPGLSATISGHVERADDTEASTYYTTLTPPRAAPTGALYFNTTDDVLKYYNGTTWVAAGGSTIPNGQYPEQTLYWTGTQWVTSPNPNFWNFTNAADDAEYEAFQLTRGYFTLGPGGRYYNTTTNKVRIYDGTTWSDLGGVGGPSTPVPLATLGTRPAGSRAFVSDSTVSAVGNFGQAVVGGSNNIVPVWTDGTSWFIG